MGKGERTKGAAGERELAGILTDQLGLLVKRNLDQAREGKNDITIGQFRIECKRVEKLNIHAAYAQALAASSPQEIPVVAFRRNRGEWMATLSLADFIRLMREFV